MEQREVRQVHLLRSDYYRQPPSYIKLVKGVVKYNPHMQVLCPTLAKGFECQKGGGGHRKALWYRPQLLVRNCGDPNLQLWSCQGSEDKFLLRVELCMQRVFPSKPHSIKSAHADVPDP